MFVCETRLAIARLAADGLSARQIALRLGLASPTVDYHLRRLAEPSAEPRPSAPPDTTRRQVATRSAVAQLIAAGISKREIARRLELAPSTVTYHARRLGAPVDERGARRYDWAAVQAYYDAGHSVRECVRHFGFSSQTWHAAVKRGAVVARPHAWTIDELCSAVPRGRHNLRRRLIAAGIKEERCETCGLAEWLGHALPIALHHVNGDRHDNRLENLQMLCPNCHAQTSTWSGRKRANTA